MSAINLDRSLELHRQAQSVLPTGVSSNAHVWRAVCPTYMPCSIFVSKANGSRLWDVDGNEYIDYRMEFGPVILGRSDSRISKSRLRGCTMPRRSSRQASCTLRRSTRGPVEPVRPSRPRSPAAV